MRLLVPGAIVVALVIVASWAGTRSGPPVAAWSLAQAESIAVVRGTPVHVLGCDGVGPVVQVDGAVLYRRFACRAGARASFQSYDTIGVTYGLQPLGPFVGASSRYALTDVSFAALSVP